MTVKELKIINKIKEWLIIERFPHSLNTSLVKHNNQLLLEYIENLQKEK